MIYDLMKSDYKCMGKTSFFEWKNMWGITSLRSGITCHVLMLRGCFISIVGNWCAPWSFNLSFLTLCARKISRRFWSYTLRFLKFPQVSLIPLSSNILIFGWNDFVVCLRQPYMKYERKWIIHPVCGTFFRFSQLRNGPIIARRLVESSSGNLIDFLSSQNWLLYIYKCCPRLTWHYTGPARFKQCHITDIWLASVRM